MKDDTDYLFGIFRLKEKHHAGGSGGEDAGRDRVLLCPGGSEPDLVGPRRGDRRGGDLAQ